MIKNARIKSTHLGREDHGIMTCYLHLEYEGAGQGFGGYALDNPVKDEDGKFLRREGRAYGMEFICAILRTLEVDSWEKLPGTHLRVDADFHEIKAIGHIIKEKWFNPKVDLTALVTK